MLTIKIALLLILAYLLGSFPTGVIVGKVFFHKDIRKLGSGNPGSTNTFRTFGPVAGMSVLLVDVLKGTLAALLPVIFHLGPHPLGIIFGMLAILGHTFSIFLGFKGGKAVATTAGFILGYNLAFFCVCAGIFFPMLFITSIMSLTAMLCITLFFIFSFLFHDPYLSAMMFVLLILIFIRHKANIVRLKNGTENIIPFGIYYWLKNK